MREYTPPRPVGSSPAARYFQAVWDRVFGGQFPFQETPNARWSRSRDGYAVTVSPARGGGGGDEIEIQSCTTGKTYLVRGREKPEAEEEEA